jgi:cell division protein FtsB
MRIRRSVTRFFGTLVIPAIAASFIGYFGYYTIFGTRGLLTYSDVQARLAVKQQELASLRADRTRLEHRIQLLQPGSVDPDLVEELARSQMLGSSPSQIAVPRDKE